MPVLAKVLKSRHTPPVLTNLILKTSTTSVAEVFFRLFVNYRGEKRSFAMLRMTNKNGIITTKRFVCHSEGVCGRRSSPPIDIIGPFFLRVQFVCSVLFFCYFCSLNCFVGIYSCFCIQRFSQTIPLLRATV